MYKNADSGGKILARYESPAHSFLYPSDECRDDNLRTIILDRSRKYKVNLTATLSMKDTSQ